MTGSMPRQEDAKARLGEAWAWLKGGRVDQARPILDALVQAHPTFAPPHELLAYACQGSGDLAGAEREMRTAARLDPAQPAYSAGLGIILRQLGRDEEAAVAFRDALQMAPQFEPAAEGLARLLLNAGRAEEAAAVLGPAARREGASPIVLALLAAAQEDLGEGEEAEAVTRRGLAARPDDADGWARLGRLQQASGRNDEAERSYRQAVAVRPQDASLHVALAELVWMRGGDLGAALASLDEALRRRPAVSLLAAKARLMARAGQAGEAYALTESIARQEPGNAGLQATAASAAAAADRRPEMLAHARAALRLRPDDRGAETLVAQARVRLGEMREAAAILDRLIAADPFDQQAIAVRAVAWRAMGDPRYREIYDYDRLIRTRTIEPPEGWSDLSGYLRNLGESLKALHRFEAHPLEQSLRGGAQTSHDLARSRDPAIRAFFRAIDAPIRDYIKALDGAPAPLRDRRAGGYRINAAWSVRLRPQGFHVSHVHPDGWLSSAFYVEVPAAVRSGDREGWLQFGEPGVPMADRPEADHFVEPEPGKLVLFPSYMLHGTRPFAGEEDRLTIAFDVTPAS